jgi:hypothetical protein
MDQREFWSGGPISNAEQVSGTRQAETRSDARGWIQDHIRNRWQGEDADP